MSYQYSGYPNPTYASVASGQASGVVAAPMPQQSYPIERVEPYTVSVADDTLNKGVNSSTLDARADSKPNAPTAGAYYYYGAQAPYQPPPPVYQPAGVFPNTAPGYDPQAARYQYVGQGEPAQSAPQNAQSNLSRGICAACVRGMGLGIGLGIGEGCVFGLCNLC
ncbi:hypothetical protein CCYA_CCYA04G1351 [Cyanidiococcus yangmingshanensis]|uniref:Uncharacterized protein n=1 Tax=Cyanidiococcus yangmingshanensis TaxID=2690220 RepID=A0A7J7IN26_9RHOD|nr:hypothetical protein F1559_001796 [Cyanidiococcus yangmingshanensis]KAK4530494.1 hypothetical protein CCYA_CCYA04G1351 [Cyanidiococcus yangmingshanensis]